MLVALFLVAAWKSPRVRMSAGAYLIASAEATLAHRRVHARRYREIVAEADKKVAKAAAVAVRHRKAITRKASAREPRDKRLAAVS